MFGWCRGAQSCSDYSIEAVLRAMGQTHAVPESRRMMIGASSVLRVL
jgi:hypothetical protein